MSITRTCWNCSTKFHPHGGQMFCSKECRLAYKEYTRPLGKREAKRIESAIEYREKWIDSKEKDEVRFYFKQCGKCGNEFAVKMSKFLIKDIKCPFCQSDAGRESMNMKYEVTTK